jgi:hypothetical protein
MKRFLLLAALFTTSSISFAQWRNNQPDYPNNNGQNGNYNNSALVLTTASNDAFTVSIDNSYQYQSNGNRVSIPNMVVGNHTVTVYETRRNIFGGQRQRVLFSGNVYFKPGIEHNMYINQNGQANFDERSLYQNGSYGNGNNGKYGNNGNGKGWGYGRMKNKHKKHGECDRDDDDERNDNRRGKW